MDTILVILLGESYSDICALADLLLCALINTNKLYGAVTKKIVAELTTNLAYLLF
jgi:hypothetical protein